MVLGELGVVEQVILRDKCNAHTLFLDCKNGLIICKSCSTVVTTSSSTSSQPSTLTSAIKNHMLRTHRFQKADLATQNKNHKLIKEFAEKLFSLRASVELLWGDQKPFHPSSITPVFALHPLLKPPIAKWYCQVCTACGDPRVTVFQCRCPLSSNPSAFHRIMNTQSLTAKGPLSSRYAVDLSDSLGSMTHQHPTSHPQMPGSTAITRTLLEAVVDTTPRSTGSNSDALFPGSRMFWMDSGLAQVLSHHITTHSDPAIAMSTLTSRFDPEDAVLQASSSTTSPTPEGSPTAANSLTWKKVDSAMIVALSFIRSRALKAPEQASHFAANPDHFMGQSPHNKLPSPLHDLRAEHWASLSLLAGKIVRGVTVWLSEGDILSSFYDYDSRWSTSDGLDLLNALLDSVHELAGHETPTLFDAEAVGVALVELLVWLLGGDNTTHPPSKSKSSPLTFLCLYVSLRFPSTNKSLDLASAAATARSLSSLSLLLRFSWLANASLKEWTSTTSQLRPVVGEIFTPFHVLERYKMLAKHFELQDSLSTVKFSSVPTVPGGWMSGGLFVSTEFLQRARGLALSQARELLSILLPHDKATYLELGNNPLLCDSIASCKTVIDSTCIDAGGKIASSLITPEGRSKLDDFAFTNWARWVDTFKKFGVKVACLTFLTAPGPPRWTELEELVVASSPLVDGMLSIEQDPFSSQLVVCLNTLTHKSMHAQAKQRIVMHALPPETGALVVLLGGVVNPMFAVARRRMQTQEGLDVIAHGDRDPITDPSSFLLFVNPSSRPLSNTKRGTNGSRNDDRHLDVETNDDLKLVGLLKRGSISPTTINTDQVSRGLDIICKLVLNDWIDELEDGVNAGQTREARPSLSSALLASVEGSSSTLYGVSFLRQAIHRLSQDGLARADQAMRALISASPAMQRASEAALGKMMMRLAGRSMMASLGATVANHSALAHTGAYGGRNAGTFALDNYSISLHIGALHLHMIILYDVIPPFLSGSNGVVDGDVVKSVKSAHEPVVPSSTAGAGAGNCESGVDQVLRTLRGSDATWRSPVVTRGAEEMLSGRQANSILLLAKTGSGKGDVWKVSSLVDRDSLTLVLVPYTLLKTSFVTEGLELRLLCAAWESVAEVGGHVDIGVYDLRSRILTAISRTHPQTAVTLLRGGPCIVASVDQLVGAGFDDGSVVAPDGSGMAAGSRSLKSKLFRLMEACVVQGLKLRILIDEVHEFLDSSDFRPVFQAASLLIDNLRRRGVQMIAMSGSVALGDVPTLCSSVGLGSSLVVWGRLIRTDVALRVGPRLRGPLVEQAGLLLEHVSTILPEVTGSKVIVFVRDSALTDRKKTCSVDPKGSEHFCTDLCSTPSLVDCVKELLDARGGSEETSLRVVGLHSKTSSDDKKNVVNVMHSSGSAMLIATSVVSCGMNFDDVGLVVSFEEPWTLSQLLQCGGRAARGDGDVGVHLVLRSANAPGPVGHTEEGEAEPNANHDLLWAERILAQPSTKCRRQLLGEEVDDDGGDKCTSPVCDVCLGLEAISDTVAQATKATLSSWKVNTVTTSMCLSDPALDKQREALWNLLCEFDGTGSTTLRDTIAEGCIFGCDGAHKPLDCEFLKQMLKGRCIRCLGEHASPGPRMVDSCPMSWSVFASSGEGNDTGVLGYGLCVSCTLPDRIGVVQYHDIDEMGRACPNGEGLKFLVLILVRCVMGQIPVGNEPQISRRTPSLSWLFPSTPRLESGISIITAVLTTVTQRSIQELKSLPDLELLRILFSRVPRTAYLLSPAMICASKWEGWSNGSSDDVAVAMSPGQTSPVVGDIASTAPSAALAPIAPVDQDDGGDLSSLIMSADASVPLNMDPSWDTDVVAEEALFASQSQDDDVLPLVAPAHENGSSLEVFAATRSILSSQVGALLKTVVVTRNQSHGRQTAFQGQAHHELLSKFDLEVVDVPGDGSCGAHVVSSLIGLDALAVRESWILAFLPPFEPCS